MNEIFFHLFFLFVCLVAYKYRYNIGNKLNLIDNPDNLRKVHDIPIPSIGGLIIFPYVISSIIFLYYLTIINIKTLLLLIFLYSSFFFVGFIDDRINLNAKTKIFILIFLLFITIPLDPNLYFETLVFRDLPKSILLNEGYLFFTIFCIFFFYNSLNFADGYNGIGILLSLYFLLVILICNNNYNVFYLSIILSLTYLLLPNILGKIFIGNSGVSFLSIVLCLLAIDTYNKGNIFFDEIILVVLLPTLDTARITIERIIQGKSPLSSDKNHFHHLLNKLFNKKYIFIPYMLIAISPYLISKFFFNTYFSLVLFVIFYFILLVTLKKKNA
tara:strand:+ start:659 stop:1645 length:987 start_codon:yes stop_codon:yes gene_type:complete